MLSFLNGRMTHNAMSKLICLRRALEDFDISYQAHLTDVVDRCVWHALLPKGS